MDWSQDSLWSKAKLYIDRAVDEERDGSLFPFWCSLALEFLARSAIAGISPTLLAEPDKEHANLIYALGKGGPKRGPISIKASLVFSLCKQFVPNFTPDNVTFCESLANRRNEELHSGGLPFESLPADWLSRFYSTSEILLISQKRGLEDFLGKKEAAAAKKMIGASMNQVIEKVKKSVSAHKTIFDEKDNQEKSALLQESEAMAKRMVSQGGHRTTCPACKAVSWVIGEEVSRQESKLEDGEIVERTAMLPMNFDCVACGLKLSGHAELQVAEIGRQFTRSVRYDPIEYYVGSETGEEYNNE